MKVMGGGPADRHKWIEQNAYFRWVNENFPNGQHLRHWLEAETEYVCSTLEAELDTICQRQLNKLLVHRYIFRQFDVTQPYVGSQEGARLADWIARNYVAFAATAVRRMIDRRRDAHSLIRVLNEVKRHCPKLSRQRMRQKYVNSYPDSAGQPAVEKADEMFDYGAGHPGLGSLTRQIIDTDISAIEQAAKAVTDVANSWITHDSKTPTASSLNFGELNTAIVTLESVLSSRAISL